MFNEMWDNAAYVDGYTSFWEGETLRKNPHLYGTEDFSYYTHGYVDAFHDAVRLKQREKLS